MNLIHSYKRRALYLALMASFIHPPSYANSALINYINSGVYTNESISDPFGKYGLRNYSDIGNTSLSLTIEDNTSFYFDDPSIVFSTTAHDILTSQRFTYFSISGRPPATIDRTDPDIVNIGNGFTFDWTIPLDNTAPGIEKALSDKYTGRFFFLGNDVTSGSSKVTNTLATINIGDNLTVNNQDGIGFEYSVVDLTIGQDATLNTQSQALFVGGEVGTQIITSHVNVGDNLQLTGGTDIGAVLAQYGVEMNFGKNSTFNFIESTHWTNYLSSLTGPKPTLYGFRANGGSVAIHIQESTINTTVNSTNFTTFKSERAGYGKVEDSLVFMADTNYGHTDVNSEIIVQKTNIHVNSIGTGAYTLAYISSMDLPTENTHGTGYILFDEVNVDAPAGGKLADINFYDSSLPDTTRNDVIIDIINSDLSDLDKGIGARGATNRAQQSIATINVTDSQLTGGVTNNSQDIVILNLKDGSTLAGGVKNTNSGLTQVNVSNQSTLTDPIINSGTGSIELSVDDAFLGTPSNPSPINNKSSGSITGLFDNDSVLTGNVTNEKTGDIELTFSCGSKMIGNGTNLSTGSLTLNFGCQSELTGDLINNGSGTVTGNFDNSTFTGSGNNNADGKLNINLENGAKWVVTDNSTINTLELTDSEVVFSQPSPGGREIGSVITVDEWDADNGSLIIYGRVDENDKAIYDKVVIGGQEVIIPDNTKVTIIDGGDLAKLLKPKDKTPNNLPDKKINNGGGTTPGNKDQTIISGPDTDKGTVDPDTGLISIDMSQRIITPEFLMYQSISDALIRGPRGLAVATLGSFNQYTQSNRANGQQGMSAGDDLTNKRARLVFGEVRALTGDTRNGATTGESDYSLYSLILGGDVYSKEQANDAYAFGLMGTYQRMDDDITGRQGLAVGNNKINTYSFGVYGRYESDAGVFANAALMGYRSSIDTRANNRAVGSYSFNATSWALSVEGGQTLAIAPKLSLTPSAQLIYQHTSIDNFRNIYAQTNFDNIDSTIVNLGTSLDYALADNYAINLQAKAWHQFNTKANLSTYGLTNGNYLGNLEDSRSSSWGELRVGLRHQTRDLEWFANIGYQGTFDGRENLLSGRAGVNVRF